MQDDRITLNGVKVFPFTSFQQLLDYVNGRKGILVAINAEKILHATPQTREIINRNIGYCDGAGAVMALKAHGVENAVKIPGCELWLNKDVPPNCIVAGNPARVIRTGIRTKKYGMLVQDQK